jgi:hypothetical protein
MKSPMTLIGEIIIPKAPVSPWRNFGPNRFDHPEEVPSATIPQSRFMEIVDPERSVEENVGPEKFEILISTLQLHSCSYK